MHERHYGLRNIKQNELSPNQRSLAALRGLQSTAPRAPTKTTGQRPSVHSNCPQQLHGLSQSTGRAHSHTREELKCDAIKRVREVEAKCMKWALFKTIFFCIICFQWTLNSSREYLSVLCSCL